MRPGRSEDLPALVDLWRREVAEGRQDMALSQDRLRRMLARFDWGARSRVVDDGSALAGAVLVTSRISPDGVLATMAVAGPPEVANELARWGLDLSRAAGASIVQCFMARGRGEPLRAAGMDLVRPWWRMDRTLRSGLPDPIRVPGYDLVDAITAPDGAWSVMFNRTFADHWRFSPRAEEEVMGDKAPELCLMAVTESERQPVAMTIGELDHYAEDSRPQPVGLISSVGTLPEHRRRGLAGWLVAELMQRLRRAGARHASLYVDGQNPMRAHEIYRKLGFAVVIEADVWEATFP